MRIYIGHDPREEEAYQVACASLLRQSSRGVRIEPLNARRLYEQRLLWRPVEEHNGQQFDHLSGMPQSTGFATSRFLVPFLARGGTALFVDCDVVFLADPAELFKLADSRYAVQVVQHQHLPAEVTKMCGQVQTCYPRKNWSSVVLWNCDHPAHHRLTLAQVNQYPGELLHRFFWLRDSEIGALPPAWNWLVGVQPRPETPKLAHFTLGGPWLPAWTPAEHDEIWHDAKPPSS